MNHTIIYTVEDLETETNPDVKAFKSFYHTVLQCNEFFKEAISIQEFCQFEDVLVIMDDDNTTLKEIVSSCFEFASRAGSLDMVIGYSFNTGGEAILFVPGINDIERAEKIASLERKYKLDLIRNLEADDILILFDNLNQEVKITALERYLLNKSHG